MLTGDSNTVTVALCADRNVLPGLHVTLFTALTHLAHDRILKVHLFSDKLSPEDHDLLLTTLTRTHKAFELQTHHADISGFRHLPWQGGWMTYFRLVLPTLLSESQFLYLDTDLLVLCDLAQLHDLDLGDYAVGAASWGPIRLSNDRDFFSRLGFDLEAPYFNAGVLLVNRRMWTAVNLTDKCMELANRYGRWLPTMDQTLLNLACYNKFLSIPRRFNTPVSANRSPLYPCDYQKRIIHLVGSPKPWDAFGVLNGQYHLFKRWLALTAWNGSAPSIWRWRYLRKSRAILRCLPNLLRNLGGVR